MHDIKKSLPNPRTQIFNIYLFSFIIFMFSKFYIYLIHTHTETHICCDMHTHIWIYLDIYLHIWFAYKHVQMCTIYWVSQNLTVFVPETSRKSVHHIWVGLFMGAVLCFTDLSFYFSQQHIVWFCSLRVHLKINSYESPTLLCKNHF